MTELRAIPIRGIGEISPGALLPEILARAARKQRTPVRAGDILVIKHKIVSKAEGRLVRLDGIKATASARRWAERYGLDARVVQLGMDQAKRIVRKGHGVMITQTGYGLVCANSGVDVSNVDGGASAVLLPEDADRSAAAIYSALRRELGFAVPVIISDSFGRPWRDGLVEVAIGLAGIKPFRDLRGRRDRYGHRLRVTMEAVADELASMAGLACEKLSHTPACIIRGFPYQPGRGRARDILRPPERDLFR